MTKLIILRFLFVLVAVLGMLSMQQSFRQFSAVAVADVDNGAPATRKSCSLTGVTEIWKQRAREITEHQATIRKPTTSRPFIFFHVRKAGGTSIREWLRRAALLFWVPSWIACHDGVPCESYNVPFDVTSNKRYAIYAAHMYFADALNVLGFSNDPGVKTITTTNEKEDTKKDKPFNCIVSLRSTVSRTVSCWNYRFGVPASLTLKNFTPAHKMTAEQWEYHLPRTYSSFREGCNNELVRVFGNVAEEQFVNNWMVNSDSDNGNGNDNHYFETCLAENELDRIMSRLSQCIVLLNDHDRCEDNKMILNHFIPWLAPYYDSCQKILNMGSIQNKTLQPGAEEAILKQNRLDEHIFQFGQMLFEEQVKTIQRRPSEM